MSQIPPPPRLTRLGQDRRLRQDRGARLHHQPCPVRRLQQQRMCGHIVHRVSHISVSFTFLVDQATASEDGAGMHCPCCLSSKGFRGDSTQVRRKARRHGPGRMTSPHVLLDVASFSQSVYILIRQARLDMLTRVATPELAQHALVPAASSKHRRSRALSGSRRPGLLLNGSLRAGCLFEDISTKIDRDMRVRITGGPV